MAIEYTVSLNDVAEFTRFHYRTTVWSPRATIKGGAVLLIIVTLLLAVTDDLAIGNFAIAVAGCTAWTIFYRPLALWILYRKARALYAPGKNKCLLGRHSLDVADDALHETSEGGTDEVQFAAIERVAEDSTHVFIYLSAMTAHIVPKSKVTGGDLAGFLAELRSRIAAAVQQGVAPDERAPAAPARG